MLYRTHIAKNSAQRQKFGSAPEFGDGFKIHFTN